jgi:hypothetical protein
MEPNLIIGNRTLLPLREAAAKVSYTRDYVARLAREGKIAAVQVDRQWYIDPESLKNFFDHAQFEVAARADYLAELRRNELEAWEVRQTQLELLEQRRTSSTWRVSVQTIGFLVLTLWVGLFIYQAAPYATADYLVAQLAQLAQVTATSEAEVDSVVAEPATPANFFWNRVGNVYINDEAITLDNGIILLPATGTSGVSTGTVEDFFSDPVQVISTDASGGVVILDSDGVTTTIPFVRIPDSATVETSPSTQ